VNVLSGGRPRGVGLRRVPGGFDRFDRPRWLGHHGVVARGATGRWTWVVAPVVVALAAVAGACTAPASRGPFAVPDRPCTDAVLLVARGSSDPVAGSVVRQIQREFTGAVAALAPGTSVRVLELGDLDGDGRPDPGGYPAVGAAATPGFDTVADPAVDPVLLGGYNDARRIGSEESVAVLTTLVDRCPLTRIVLAGYSMGADALAAALSDLPAPVADRVVSVQLFGDPRFAVGPWMRAPGAVFPSGHGLLGARTPYVPDAFVARTESWCGEADGMCTGQLPVLLFQLVSACTQWRALAVCSRRHVDYGLWAIPAAMADSAALVSAGP
jgi:hypothetical protein